MNLMRFISVVSHKSIALAACFTLGTLGAFEASAGAIVGLQVEGGGTAQWHQLDNGNVLGLWGFDNREGANPSAGAVTIPDAQALIDGFTVGGGSIVAFYDAAFDPFSFSFEIADDARLFDSLWIESTGGTLVYQQPNGRSTTTHGFGSAGLRDGDPIGTGSAPVPAPAPLALIGAGIALLALNRRRKVK